MSTPLDMQALLTHRDIDSRIKASRDDMLHIMQSEHRYLEVRISAVENEIKSVEKNLGARIDSVEKNLEGKIDKLDSRIDKLDSRIDTLCTEFMSMKRWGIGLFLGALATIAAIAVPAVILLLSR